ncbi:MAG: rod-binding protein [Bacteroidales bacterium]|nr:rod-binding protein [Clostridium sp.]MCM1203816.1 rod-binding protein [Bacteroidales bacterium]
MAITGIDSGSYYGDYSTKASEASASALESTLGKVNNQSTEEELMAACKEFEAYFLEQIYKGMEKTIMKADEDESGTAGLYREYFGDMQIQAYAKAATEQGDGIGLAKQLYEQMKRNYGL